MSVYLFDAALYQAANPDLAAAGLNTRQDLEAHFRNHGLSESRLFSNWVDLQFYQANSPDLAGFTPVQLWEHLRQYGIAEGRDFTPFIDLDYYIATNPDVAAACKGDRTLAFNHLIEFGLAENRPCSPDFKFDAVLGCFVDQDTRNLVVAWNQVLLNAIKEDKTAPPLAARNLAILHTSIFDAVNAIAQDYTPYYVSTATPLLTSPEAAISAAAHQVLITLYPSQADIFNQVFAESLAKIPNGKSEQDGIILGQFVANQILAWRSQDQADQLVIYQSSNLPGNWQPTPPGFQPALLPQWANVEPFTMTQGSQFRPDGPPDLNSAEYALELNQVQALGGKDSLLRTPEQLEIALFWADGAGTYTPPGHWNEISQDIAMRRGSNLLEDARLFALLNLALADAAIVAWDAKYEYNLWRPVTAIRQADNDGNDQTIADQRWESAIATPPFPEYISGHSTFSGAADVILTSIFGENVNFTTSSVGLSGISRSFNRFSQAAEEAGMSRIYGGIHFLSGNQDGLTAGRNLGNYILDNFLLASTF